MILRQPLAFLLVILLTQKVINFSICIQTPLLFLEMLFSMNTSFLLLSIFLDLHLMVVSFHPLLPLPLFPYRFLFLILLVISLFLCLLIHHIPLIFLLLSHITILHHHQILFLFHNLLFHLHHLFCLPLHLCINLPFLDNPQESKPNLGTCNNIIVFFFTIFTSLHCTTLRYFFFL